MDAANIAKTLQQVMALANLGGAVVQAGAGVVAQVTSILQARGYEVDTRALDELIADAERRQQLAESEKDATS